MRFRQPGAMIILAENKEDPDIKPGPLVLNRSNNNKQNYFTGTIFPLAEDCPTINL